MLIQQVGRRFAQRHPEFGRFREEGGECGKTCGCANWKNCAMKKSEVRDQRSGFQRFEEQSILPSPGSDP